METLTQPEEDFDKVIGDTFTGQTEQDIGVDNDNNQDPEPEPEQQQPDTSQPHAYMLALNIANITLSKLTKKDLNFNDIEQKQVNELLWRAYPQAPQMSPKMELLITLGVIYGSKFGLLKF